MHTSRVKQLLEKFNKHWKESKEALHVIPNNFIKGRIIPSNEPNKYKYFYKANGKEFFYIIGIPSDKGDATTLITCMRK